MKLNKKILLPIILVIISIIPLLDFFHPGLPITHDGQDHVARIANFYQNLTEGNIVPRWAGNLNWGYGHPILMFLYPLPSYLASMFHYSGFSFVDSVKIVFSLGFVFSGIFMYLWLKKFLGEISGFVGAILYMFAPYRFVDLHVRGAIGEHIAFVFIPLVFYFTLRIYENPKKILNITWLSFSLALLVLSHNATSLMILPVLALYAFYLWFFGNRNINFLVQFTVGMILGFFLSSFFWLPAFFEGKYTLRDIVTRGEFTKRFIEFGNFIKMDGGYDGKLTFEIGPVHWIMAILAVPATILLIKQKKKIWVLTLLMIIVYWISIFLMLPISKIFWEKITTLQKFQFPWRFLSISVFATSVLGSLFVSAINKKYIILLSIVILFFVLFLDRNYWHVKNYLYKPESFYSGIYESSTDTGESAPIWSVRFMEHKPKTNVEIIAGKGIIAKGKRTSVYREYRLDAEEKVRIRENTLYFPGWNVLIDGKQTVIEFQDPANRGLITFFADKGLHSIIVEFKDTKIRTVANITTLAGIIAILLILSKGFLWRHSQ